jgi:hypothetical protein
MLRKLKTNYMVMSRDQNAEKNSNTKMGNKSFESEEQFEYLEKTLSNQNSIHEEIKSRLKSGNACYHSVQNILSSSLLSKDIKLKISRVVILPVVLYGNETLSRTLREDCRLRVFQNRLLRRIFGSKRDEAKEEWRRIHYEELYALYSSPNIIRVIKSRRMRRPRYVAHMGDRRG